MRLKRMTRVEELSLPRDEYNLRREEKKRRRNCREYKRMLTYDIPRIDISGRIILIFKDFRDEYFASYEETTYGPYNSFNEAKFYVASIFN